MNIIGKPFIILHTKKSLNRAVSFFVKPIVDSIVFLS